MLRTGASLLAALLALLGGCAPPPWRVVAEVDGAWLLSVTAAAERVLCAGGRPRSGAQAGEGLILRLRGTEPARRDDLKSPVPGMLWWVHDAGGAAWFAGEDGALLRYEEGADGTPSLRVVPTGTTAVLYGVWAFSDSDVWAVGGDDKQGGVVLHGGAAGLTVDTSVPKSGVLYKIFATDPQHLFVVGGAGALLRYVIEGGVGRWVQDPSPLPPNERLLTVHGRAPDEIYAVGGLGMARLLRFSGAAWSVVDTPGLGGLNGVFAEHGGDLLLGGARGLLAAGPGTGPFAAAEPLTTQDLHGVSALGGERLAAGGNLSQFGVAPARGILLQQGGPSRRPAQ